MLIVYVGSSTFLLTDVYLLVKAFLAALTFRALRSTFVEVLGLTSLTVFHAVTVFTFGFTGVLFLKLFRNDFHDSITRAKLNLLVKISLAHQFNTFNLKGNLDVTEGGVLLTPTLSTGYTLDTINGTLSTHGATITVVVAPVEDVLLALRRDNRTLGSTWSVVIETLCAPFTLLTLWREFSVWILTSV